MTEEYPFDPGLLGDDEAGIEKSLRPARLEEFIGQERIVENLQIAIGAARARKEVLDHVLFSGMPGLGKTTLSFLIANAMEVDIHCASGPALQKGKDVVGLLTGLKRGDVLFIDEIHRISSETEEYLYSAMEDFKVDVVIDSGPDARSFRLTIEAFTLVGATTREGFLSAPFRSRFGIVEKLEPYPPEDLLEIICRSAALLGCSMTRSAAETLARRCRGTPRYANRFLRRIRDVAQYRSGWDVHEDRPLRLTGEHVEEGLDRLGVDAHGLDRVDRKILDILLAQDEPVGVKTLAVSVGEEERTIEDVHEPYLIQRGMLVKTPRGRRASSLAYELYKPQGRLL
jgi:Holliday junction DNA helicase RuvB